MILDVYFYPPKVSYPINHRTLADLEAIKYGENYMTEMIIGMFVLFTIFCRPNILATQNYFLEVLYIIPRTFIHQDLLHLMFNSLTFYPVGKLLSAEIGPFHLLAFLIVSNIFSYLLARIIELHLHSAIFYSMIGASGAIFAILAKYFTNRFMIFKVFWINLTGYEHGIYSILISILLLLTDLIPYVSHSGHLSGIVFGIFAWDLSIKAWKFRDLIHKKMTNSQIN